MDFSGFLSPRDAQARFKKELSDRTLVEGMDLTSVFDNFWAITTPDTKIQAVGDVEYPEIIFTTKEALLKHPEHFRDMKIIPAYPKENRDGA